MAEQRRFGPHRPCKHLLQLVAAGVVRAIAGGAHQMLAAHAAIGKGAQHFQLVVFFDFLQGCKLPGAQPARLPVQLQQARADIIEFFYHLM